MEEKEQGYNPDFTKLHEYFSKKSTMEILGVDRDENAHSNFLAWLFENEKTGKEACWLLIELLKKKAEDVNKTIPITIQNFIKTDISNLSFGSS